MDPKVQHYAQQLIYSYKTGELLPPPAAAESLSSLDQAYQVQEYVAQNCGLHRGGWKLGCTSEISQKNLGSVGPITGRMFKERFFLSGAVLNDVRFDMLLVEAEFAFQMDTDLPARSDPYDAFEVIDALGVMAPAIELVQSRFKQSRLPIIDIVADNAGAGSLIMGKPVTDWREHDLATQLVRLTGPQGEIARGHGADVLGNPINAMVWLANFVSRRGLGLRAGEFITTGTCFAPQLIDPGSEITADFGSFGATSVKFEKASAWPPTSAPADQVRTQ